MFWQSVCMLPVTATPNIDYVCVSERLHIRSAEKSQKAKAVAAPLLCSLVQLAGAYIEPIVLPRSIDPIFIIIRCDSFQLANAHQLRVSGVLCVHQLHVRTVYYVCS